MKFTFHRLGALDHADIDLNNLTIVCGKNNIGKTYLTYALYGFLNTWKYFLDAKISSSDYATLREKGNVEIDIEKQYHKKLKDHLEEAAKKYKEKLSDVLAAQEGRFEETQIDLDVSIPKNIFSKEFTKEFKSEKGSRVISFKRKKGSPLLEISSVVTDDLKTDGLPKGLIDNMVKEAAWGFLFPKPFIVSTERTGAVTFRSELNLARNRLIEYAHKLKAGDEYSPMSLIESVFSTGYPMPVSDNVEYINGLNKTENKNSSLINDHPDLTKDLEGIIGGSYKTSKDGDVNFVPKKSKQKLKMGESSSAVRSLVLLSYYIRYTGQTGDLLIIDEPELNLHPSNQRKLARLIARLVNVGVKVFITTHSDYFIKEFNTLIMLKNQNEAVSSIKKEYGYRDSELLDSSAVSLYTIKEDELYLPTGNQRKVRGTILSKADIDPKLGIEAPSFDETINQMNEIQDKLYSAMIS